MSEYLAADKALTAAATVLILMAGWLFTLIINTQTHARDRQEDMVERIAKLESFVELHKINARSEVIQSIGPLENR